MENKMSTIRIDSKRWQKLTEAELRLSLKKGEIIKKSKIINYFIDNHLDSLEIHDGEIVDPQLIEKNHR